MNEQKEEKIEDGLSASQYIVKGVWCVISLSVYAGVIWFLYTMENRDWSQLAHLKYVTASPDKVDQANDGKVVFLHGKLAGAEQLHDDEFGVSGKGLMLVRLVETASTYSGMKGTVRTRWNSVNEDNKSQGPFQSRKFDAASVRIGSYTPTPELLTHVTEELWKRMPVDMKAIALAPASKKGQLTLDKGDGNLWYKKGEHEGERISFLLLPELGEITVLAKQSGNNLTLIDEIDKGVIMQGNHEIRDLYKTTGEHDEGIKTPFYMFALFVLWCCSMGIVGFLAVRSPKPLLEFLLQVILIVTPAVVMTNFAGSPGALIISFVAILVFVAAYWWVFFSGRRANSKKTAS